MDCAACGHENGSDARFCRELWRAAERHRYLPELLGGEPRWPGILQRLWRCAERAGRTHHRASCAPRRRRSAPWEGDGGRAQAGHRPLRRRDTGSMELAERTDPEEWRQIMDRFFGILCEGVHMFEGTVDKFTGDGIMALFGAPIAHEDHAQRACFAALRLIDELAGFTAELRRTKGLNFLGPDGPQLGRGGGRRDRRGPRNGVHGGRPHRRPRAEDGAAGGAGQGLSDRAHRSPRPGLPGACRPG